MAWTGQLHPQDKLRKKDCTCVCTRKYSMIILYIQATILDGNVAKIYCHPKTQGYDG